MKIALTNPVTNQIKECPIDTFNWWVFFFSILVPLYRRDWKWFGIGLLLAVVLFLIPVPGASKGCAAIGLIGGFFYNFWYVKGLIRNGWKVTTLPNGITPKQLKRLGLPSTAA